MVDKARTCFFALALVACGGKSSSTEDANGADDSSVGGSRGGRSGSGGAPQGGNGPAGGNPVGGSAPLGGTAGSGGARGGSGGVGGECDPFFDTNIVGTVRDPAGVMPVYNVLVYVPLEPLEPLPELPRGVVCDVCDVVVPAPFGLTLTDASGAFRVPAPPGRDVPLVIQIGKWRREITVPLVEPCVDTVIDDPDLTRLPRSRSEGNLPRIAVVTGAEDSPECFLRRVGIADSEFAAADLDSAVNLFVGCDGGSGTGAARFSPALGGAAFLPASALFTNFGLLHSYDFVFFGCEGSACESEKAPYRDTLEAYVDSGGRLFLDHHQSYWLRNGPAAWQGLATFRDGDTGTTSGQIASVDRTFPKGDVLANWLLDNSIAVDTLGEIPILSGTSVSSVSPPTQRWLYGDVAPDADSIGIFSLTARIPVDAFEPEQCGRIVFNDFHALSGAFDSPDVSRSEIPFPNGCISGPHSPQEAAMQFHLFDIPVCIQSDDGPVPPGP